MNRSSHLHRLRRRLEQEGVKLLQPLRALCRVPSVASRPDALAEAAEQVEALWAQAGVRLTRHQQPGHPPILTGEVGQGAVSLLLYNHYDVQPASSEEGWTVEPFEAALRQGTLYARGAADNKGNLVARAQAVRLYREEIGELPVRLQLLIEGEEEIGSPGLLEFVAGEGRDWRADAALWEGGYKDPDGRPTVACGMKGLLLLEVRSGGLRHDLHSMWGTIAPNPAWRLVEGLGTLVHDGELRIDGLEERIRPLDAADRQALASIPLDEGALRERLGLSSLRGGLTGEALKVAHFLRPTITLEGLRAGHTGPETKTIVPARAVARLDLRLVPDLEPQHVVSLIRHHLTRRGYGDLELEALAALPPARTPLDHPLVQAARRAAEIAYGQPPVVYPLFAASGPMAPVCQARGIPAVSAGIGHARSNIHGPDENIRLADYREGILFLAALFEEWAKETG